MGNCHQCFEGFGKPAKKDGFKVCICGGATSVGQQLALLMATNSMVKELSVYDLEGSSVPAEGVAADLSHLETLRCRLNWALENCLEGCSLVLVAAGIPRRPSQSKRDLMHINGNMCKMVVEACAKRCPEAIVGLIVNPINSVVPAMARLYEKKGLDPRKIIGVTTLDVVRANKFVFEATGAPVDSINVPVIGGHAGKSEKASAGLPLDKRKLLDVRLQEAGAEVVRAKSGKGSATLSLGYAGSNVTELEFFTSPVTFGPRGVERVHPVPRLDNYDQERLAEAKTVLKEEIDIGLEFAQENELIF
eukprot:s1053_g4.t1